MTFSYHKGYTIRVYPIRLRGAYTLMVEILDESRAVGNLVPLEKFYAEASQGIKKADAIEYALRRGRQKIDEQIATSKSTS